MGTAIDSLIIPAWMKILRVIYYNPETSNSKIMRSLDITYSHVCTVIDLFVALKVVTVVRVGRTNRIVLTKDGIILAASAANTVESISRLG